MNRSRCDVWTWRGLSLVVGCLAVLLLVVSGPAVVAAQETSEEGHERPEGVSFEILAQAVAEELPAAPAQIFVSRVTIAPGADDEVEPGPGVGLFSIETGTLAFSFEGPATVIRAGAAAAPAPQEQTKLGAGDAFLTPAGVGFEVRNEGTDPAQVLLVGVIPAEGEEASVAETRMAEAGIALQALALGVASDMPSGSVVIGVGLFTLEPGVSGPVEEPHAGPALVILESGTVGVTVTEGETHVLRAASMATPGAEPAPPEVAPVGAEITLNAGDALFAQTGSSEKSRNLGDVPAVALVVHFAPAGATGETEEAAAGTPMP